MAPEKTIVIGIDTGGTFTDFVYIRGGRIRVLKVLSTPENPAAAVLEGLGQIQSGSRFDYSIIHGSTVATNALLERRGARTALITTRGFRDLLEIGRQNRPLIYDLYADRPAPLIPSPLRFEITERTLHTGEIMHEADRKELGLLLKKFMRKKIESVAVCFLHSYVNPHNEELVAREAGQAGFRISRSSEILPEYREYERLSTTVVNAYVAPKMDRYIESIQKKFPGIKLRIMKSNGGIISAETARRESVHTILSGPAGGVVGAFTIARKAGYPHCITFDMGGTSTDVSLCHGRIMTTSESTIAGCPVRVPVIDIHTVGAGGGSTVSLDIGGALKVGPESAGADPGPVCYGKGDLLTVTDANLALGRLHADHFLGGGMRVFPERTEKRLQELSKLYSLSPEKLSAGIIRVVNSSMEKALRVISIAKGYNPADFALVTFGGAGALHAADLARTLNIRTVIVPGNPGNYSAVGMLFSNFVKDYSHTVLIPAEKKFYRKLADNFKPLERKALLEMKKEGISSGKIGIELSADVRYKGQSFELTVPFANDYVGRFHKAHMNRYGYADPERPAEVVTIRLRCTGRTAHPRFRKATAAASRSAREARIGKRPVYDGSAFTDTDVYMRDKMTYGMKLNGPAVIHEYSTTTYVPPDFKVTVDEYDNLILTH
ncbi:hydantoinase/oxoprolinase family protein [candidate division KSB1 bacterium]